MITKHQFKRLRANVAAMQDYNFTHYIHVNVAFAQYVLKMFGSNPYYWLAEQGIRIDSVKDYRAYCLRWLDHVEKDVCK